MTATRAPFRRMRPLPHLSSVMPTHEVIESCPFTNPPASLERILAAMVSRSLHPGRGGPLNTALPPEDRLRQLNPLWITERMARKGARRP